MGFWDNLQNVNGNFDSSKETKKAEGFDENQKEIEKVSKYLKEKREAFYKNNNLKER